MSRRRRNDGSSKPFKSLNISRDWLLRAAELEGNGCISVGGLAVRAGLYRSEPEPPPAGPSDRELLEIATLILVALRDAETTPDYMHAQDHAEAFLILWGEGKGSPRGVLSDAGRPQ